MPCCYLLPYVFNVHLLLAYCQLVTTEQRFERHALPTDHIVVHSSYSNVSVADWIVVISDESKVEFQERFLHGKIWSGNSTLNFEPHGQTENFSAHNDVLSIFELSQMFLRANRSTDGHSYMEYRADMNVSLIFSSGVTQVNAFSGRWAHVSAVTWQLPIPGRVTIGSSILNDLSRKLHIVSLSSNYNINMTIFGAQMQMRYGNITVQITSDYRFLRIRSGLYVINLKTVVSPFEISISDHEMIVRCENERAIVQLLPNSSNIIISTNQYSRVVIDRGREAVILGGREMRPAGNINLLSMQLKILLKSGNISSIHASANHSQITIQTTSTNMASTAAHHAVDFIGGKIDLNVFTGNVSMDIIANTHLESLPTMLTPFLTPQNNFHDIKMDTNHNFPTDERNNGSNYLVSVTQVPLTMASHSISDENNDFPAEVAATTDDHIYKSILESMFTIPLLPRLTVSTIKPTSTVSLVFPEQSSTTILTSRITSTSSSSSGNTALSHTENTSHIGFITKTTKTERMGTSTEASSLPKASETASASIISLNASTVSSSSMLSTVRTTNSNSTFSLMNVPSSMFSSSATMLSNIPLKTLTNSRTGKESDDENSEYVQTDFIEFSWDNVGESSIPITTTATIVSTSAQTDKGQNLAPEKMRSTECIDIEPSKRQSIPLTTVIATSKPTGKPIVVKTNRSIGSAWTPFASLPFEFPPTARYPSTASFRNGNFILQNDEAKGEIAFDRNEISKDKDWNKSALDVPSVPVITALKEFFGKIVQRDSARKKSQNNHENPGTEFGQQQNFFSSSKFKRALSSFANEEIYEIQLKVPFDISLTAMELHRELLLALKKFALFTNLHERQLPISEDAIRIKITNMERNGEYLKVLYSVFINTEVISYTNDCSDGINEASNCAQSHGFSGTELPFIIVGILIVLFCIGTLLAYHKHCYVECIQKQMLARKFCTLAVVELCLLRVL